MSKSPKIRMVTNCAGVDMKSDTNGYALFDLLWCIDRSVLDFSNGSVQGRVVLAGRKAGRKAGCVSGQEG